MASPSNAISCARNALRALDSGNLARAREYARQARSSSITNELEPEVRSALLSLSDVASSSSVTESSLRQALNNFLSAV